MSSSSQDPSEQFVLSVFVMVSNGVDTCEVAPVPRPPVQKVAKPVCDAVARLPSGGDGSSWPGADDTTRHVDTTVAKAVGEARPPGIAEHSITTA